MMKHTSVGLLAVLLAGCAVTSRLERRQSRALAEYAPREQTAPKPAEKRNYMTVQHDSTTYYIAEAAKDENGETVVNFRLDEVSWWPSRARCPNARARCWSISS